mgnify:CR=1 FL=1
MSMRRKSSECELDEPPPRTAGSVCARVLGAGTLLLLPSPLPPLDLAVVVVVVVIVAFAERRSGWSSCCDELTEIFEEFEEVMFTPMSINFCRPLITNGLLKNS